MDSRIVGVDVGGANLKYAALTGQSVSRSFPMWRQPESLAETVVDDLRSNFEGGRAIKHLAVTMTGELADCFVDRAEGVSQIVSHLVQAASALAIEDVQFYGVDGGFHDASWAATHVDVIAAANWHALASWVGRSVAADATLIDIGSTTTDIVPIADGRVATQSQTDFDRLREGSLVYVGCRRTPVCALVDSLLLRGDEVPVMNELFATIDDAMILVNATGEDRDDCDSADGKPRTLDHAAARMARMLGLDRRSISTADAKVLAEQIVTSAIRRVGEGLSQIGFGPTVVISGHGSQLIDLPSGLSVIRLADTLGADTARSAPALAVATLRRLQLDQEAGETIGSSERRAEVSGP
ncbi:MAG: hydantoinase/oxoprolinase family protein [Rubripirellula sp.]